MRKVIGIGETILDILFRNNQAATSVPGGSTFNSMISLGRVGVPSCFLSEIGDDKVGSIVRSFLKDNGEKLVETSSGKLIKYQAYYDGYALELNMEQHIVSRSSSYTADSRTIKNVDESYNEYQFVIRTDIEPWSTRIDKYAAKQAKRDAKGKKKRSVEELM